MPSTAVALPQTFLNSTDKTGTRSAGRCVRAVKIFEVTIVKKNQRREETMDEEDRQHRRAQVRGQAETAANKRRAAEDLRAEQEEERREARRLQQLESRQREAGPDRRADQKHLDHRNERRRPKQGQLTENL